MFDTNGEKGIEKYPFQISIKDNLEIIEQSKKCVCQIITDKKRGTGFFCKFFNFYDDKEMKILITNNHVIGSEELKQNNIKIFFYNGYIMPLKLNNSRRYFTKIDLDIDITIIELKEEDRITNCLELDENFCQIKAQDLYSKYKNKAIYTLFYSNELSYISYGIIKDIREKQIIHSCSTELGASGSPVCLLGSKKIIGLHVGGLKWEANNSVLLKYGILEFLNDLNKKKTEQESICYLPIETGKNNNHLNNNKMKKLEKKHISNDNYEKSNNLKKEFPQYKIEDEELDEKSYNNIIFNNKRIIGNPSFKNIENNNNKVNNKTNCNNKKLISKNNNIPKNIISSNVNSNLKNNIVNQNNLQNKNINLNNQHTSNKNINSKLNNNNTHQNNLQNRNNLNNQHTNNKNIISKLNNNTNQNNLQNKNNLNNQYINKKNIISKLNNNIANQNNLYNNNILNQNNVANKYNYINNNAVNNYISPNNTNIKSNNNINQNNINYIPNNLYNNNYNQILNNPNQNNNVYFVDNQNNINSNYINSNNVQFYTIDYNYSNIGYAYNLVVPNKVNQILTI